MAIKIYSLIVSFFFTTASFAGVCLKLDSNFYGNANGNYSKYIYDVNGRLNYISDYNSGAVAFNTKTIFYYTNNLLDSSVKFVFSNNALVRFSKMHFFNSGDRLVAIRDYQNLSSNNNFMHYDVIYNANKISKILFDSTACPTLANKTSVQSFDNIMYDVNGNMTSMSITQPNMPIINFTLTYDDKINLFKYIGYGASFEGVLMYNNKNNYKEIKYNGIPEIEKKFTYDNMGNVVTMSDSINKSYRVFKFVDCNANFVSINGSTDLNLKLFPNPTKDILFIESVEEIVSISIIENTGKELSDVPIKDNSIDLSSLSSGFYIITLKMNNGTIEKRNFIKE